MNGASEQTVTNTWILHTSQRSDFLHGYCIGCFVIVSTVSKRIIIKKKWQLMLWLYLQNLFFLIVEINQYFFLFTDMGFIWGSFTAYSHTSLFKKWLTHPLMSRFFSAVSIMKALGTNGAPRENNIYCSVSTPAPMMRARKTVKQRVRAVALVAGCICMILLNHETFVIQEFRLWFSSSHGSWSLEIWPQAQLQSFTTLRSICLHSEM